MSAWLDGRFRFTLERGNDMTAHGTALPKVGDDTLAEVDAFLVQMIGHDFAECQVKG